MLGSFFSQIRVSSQPMPQPHILLGDATTESQRNYFGHSKLLQRRYLIFCDNCSDIRTIICYI